MDNPHTSMPERIWARIRGGGVSLPSGKPYVSVVGEDREMEKATEYVRADLVSEIDPAAANTDRETEDWDGLECSCGGGWKVGHRAGCPEAHIIPQTSASAASIASEALDLVQFANCQTDDRERALIQMKANELRAQLAKLAGENNGE